MREKIIAGNWKMNHNKRETELSLQKIIQKIPDKKNTTIMVAPAFVNLEKAIEITQNSPLEIIAQNMHNEKNGAFTGEISADMLKSIGINTTIIGHSERRTLFKETDEFIFEKIKSALKNNITTIFCFGEKLKDRKKNQHFNLIQKQFQFLLQLKKENWNNIILAYEPVWAIGTGETATPEQAQEIHHFIRKMLTKKYNDKLAQKTTILYGGSIKPNNAKEIFLKPDVDGGLIGGASLITDDFLDIINQI